MSERRALAARPPRGTLLARWPQAAASGLWGLLFTTPSGRPRGCSAPLPRAPPAAWVPPQRPGTCQADPWAAGVRGLGPRVSLCPTAPRCGGLCQAASEPAGCGWKCRPAGCSGALPGGEACWGQGRGLQAPAPPSRTPGSRSVSELQTPEPPAVPQDWAALDSTRAHFLPAPRGGEGHPRAGVHPALLCSPLSEEATEGWLHDAQRPTRRPSWAGGTVLLNAEPPLRLPQKGGCRCPPPLPTARPQASSSACFKWTGRT